MTRNITSYFDISQALDALDLPADMQVFDTNLGGPFGEMRHDEPYAVYIDLRRIAAGLMRGCQCSSCSRLSLENVIGHELVHQMQLRRDGATAMSVMNATHDTSTNPIEIEAERLESAVGRLIKRR